jgi:hypothetical protein
MEMSQKNTVFIAKTNKNVIFFYKIREQEGRTGAVWGCWHQWDGAESGELVKGGANTVYTYMKKEK